jgi:thiol-disulfide isomerase/thioredoxin
MTKRTAIVGFFCVLLLCAVAESGTHSGLVLTDLTGNQVPVDSLLEAGPVVLNFWTTWCKPCRLEMPHLQKVAGKLADSGVHFAAISLDDPRRMKDVEAYLKKHEVTLPIYHDTKWELAKRFKVLGIPTTVVLDREAEVHYRTRGYRPGDEIILTKKIEALIKDAKEPNNSVDQ